MISHMVNLYSHPDQRDAVTWFCWLVLHGKENLFPSYIYFSSLFYLHIYGFRFDDTWSYRVNSERCICHDVERQTGLVFIEVHIFVCDYQPSVKAVIAMSTTYEHQTYNACFNAKRTEGMRRFVHYLCTLQKYFVFKKWLKILCSGRKASRETDFSFL